MPVEAWSEPECVRPKTPRGGGCQVTVYRPKPSPVWASLGLPGLALVALGGWTLSVEVSAVGGATGLWPGLLLIVIGSCFFIFWSWVPSMRYELDDDELRLICGPVRYRLSLAAIVSVERRNLTPTLWSSLRVPGFALTSVLYSDVGVVFMCSARVANGVILIDAGRHKYGISPRDETAFIAELTARLKGGAP